MTIRLATAQSDDAHRVATTDRNTSADLVLSMAVTDAADLFAEGRPRLARLRLARGLASAERILGQSRPEVGL